MSSRIIRLDTKTLRNVIAESTKRVLLEMATFGTEKWGNNTYKIAVHGASTKDRPIPHIHIYLNNDANYKLFNFEISFVDILCKDEINLIYQYDRANHIRNTNRNNCSWNGYADILKGFKKFLFSQPILGRFGTFKDNLERAIYEWNRETDFAKTEQGGNPLKEYLDSKGITILEKYKGYF